MHCKIDLKKKICFFFVIRRVHTGRRNSIVKPIKNFKTCCGVPQTRDFSNTKITFLNSTLPLLSLSWTFFPPFDEKKKKLKRRKGLAGNKCYSLDCPRCNYPQINFDSRTKRPRSTAFLSNECHAPTFFNPFSSDSQIPTVNKLRN